MGRKKTADLKPLRLKPDQFLAIDFYGVTKMLGLADIRRLVEVENKLLMGRLDNIVLNAKNNDSERSKAIRGTKSLLTIGRLIKTILAAVTENVPSEDLKDAIGRLVSATNAFNGSVNKRSPDRLATDVEAILRLPIMSTFTENDKVILANFISDFRQSKAALFKRKRVPRPNNRIGISKDSKSK